MHSRVFLRRTAATSSSYQQFYAAQRLHLRPFTAGPSSSEPPSSSSSPSWLRLFGGSNNPESHNTSADSAVPLRSLSSLLILVGWSLGFCLCSSSPNNSNSFLCYADSTDDSEEPENKSKFLFGDDYRKKVFFKYEKRMRMQSPPEKVFEYFASFRAPSGEVFMTATDLMRSVVPVFPPSEAPPVRGGSLKGELLPVDLHCPPSKFFMLFDTNNDGLISFAEYIFLVTLLSIPESSFSAAFKMFDLDNNGVIDKEEFKKVMALMRNYNRQGARHRNGRRIGLKVSGPVESGGLVEYFFGKDDACLEHQTFIQFLRDLHDEMLRLEFAHYDYKNRGTMSAKDFALSMVASADIKHIDKFLQRVDELAQEPQLGDIRITFEEFRSFADLCKRLRTLSMAIFCYGKVNGQLTKHDFQRAAYQVCGVALTDSVVDMIFFVFDANRDGSLSSDEFLNVLQKREFGNLQTTESSFMGLLSCWLDCRKNCSSSKIFV